MATFNKQDGSGAKRYCHHGDMVWHTSSGPKDFVLVQAPRASKFANKPAYVKFKVPPDDTVYELDIDSPQVGQTLEQMTVGATYRVRATGKRETAALEVVGNGAVVPAAAPAPAYQPAGSQPAQAAWQPGGPYSAASAPAPHPQPAYSPQTNGAPLARQYFACLTAAHEVVLTYLGQHTDDYGEDGLPTAVLFEAVRTCASSLFIESNRNPARPLTKEG